MKTLYQLVTAPASEPVTLAEAKTHLRRDDITDDDTYITNLIKAARRQAEKYSNRVFIDQTWKMYLSEFPSDQITIHKAIINSITSIKYYDTNNSLQTITSTNYESVIEDEDQWPYILPIDTYDWPDTYDKAKAVIIEFQAGWEDADAVPEDIKDAIKIMVAEMYEIRQDTLNGSFFKTDFFQNILNKIRISTF